jgi:hypothetical protein
VRPLLPLTLALLACKPVEKAPVEFDELCAFLYAHALDDDPELLGDGLANLHAWLADHPEEPLEGYAVADLDEDLIASLPGRERAPGDVKGAAVLTESPYAPDALASVLLLEDQLAVFPDTYTVFDRTYDLADPTCFADDPGCELVVTENHMIVSMPLSIVMDTETVGEFRWAPSPFGRALLNRNRFTRPAELSVDWLTVDDQFFLSVTMPREGGGAWRVQMTWVVAELLGGGVPEGTALRMTINGLRNADEELYGYIGGGSE